MTVVYTGKIYSPHGIDFAGDRKEVLPVVIDCYKSLVDQLERMSLDDVTVSGRFLSTLWRTLRGRNLTQSQYNKQATRRVGEDNLPQCLEISEINGFNPLKMD